MSSRLPEYVDPWRLANLGKVFSGVTRLAELPRLAEALLSADVGEVLFSLEFYRDEKRRARVKGNVRAELSLICQRCMGRMKAPVNADMDLAIIEVFEEAEKLSPDCDPVLVNDGRIRLMDLLEDELLLAIPHMPMHDEAVCEVKLETYFPDAGEVQGPESTANENNPFAVLAGLKSDKQN
ncbi:YceD family protein [Candidatus Vondammii sp. HM_W22]|uniref:YceD family protein n=1 Tax=Candidatus Vondammii sp. HM_W22 TaxID=2687299 RepID=UPI001F129070|nr:YceD family protein [Candidatus Vondammii sp. HM_W22]